MRLIEDINTGGTALSVFYLHHRKSDDLDFFTTRKVKLSEIDFWVLRKFDNAEKTNLSEFTVSYLINEVKVDFVIDKLSLQNIRESYTFENKASIEIDNLENIISNKLCTLVSRTEVKDFIDFYFLCSGEITDNINKIYEDAKNKDLVFADPPTVGYTIEEGYNKIASMDRNFFPKLLKPLNEDNFADFYKKLVNKIYSYIN